MSFFIQRFISLLNKCLRLYNLAVFCNFIKSMQMKRGYSRFDKPHSDSDSKSSNQNSSSQDPQDLYKELKKVLEQNDRYAYKIIFSISKTYKENLGVLRISLPESFTFNQNDIEQFFRKFGKIQNIILKQSSKHLSQDQVIQKQQSIAYVIYSEYFSALLALRILNSMDQKERIITAKLCVKKTQQEEKLFSGPLIGSIKLEDMITYIDEDYEFEQSLKVFKYKGVIGLDLNDKTFQIKQRILGVQGCNFIRVQYMCQKMFRFEHQNEDSQLEDLVLKLVVNRKTETQRQVLVLSNSLEKYNHAMKLLHELLQQIVEQYKNSREKSQQIIPKDIHIKKWQKFSLQYQLKFLNS